MPSFYHWILRLFLAVSLGLLVVTIRTLWPGVHGAGWLDLAGVGALVIATLGVGAWTVSAWLDDQ